METGTLPGCKDRADGLLAESERLPKGKRQVTTRGSLQVFSTLFSTASLSQMQAFLSTVPLLAPFRLQSSHARETCQDCLRAPSSQVLTWAFGEFSILQCNPLLSCLPLVLW